MKIKINILLIVLIWSCILQAQTQPTGTAISYPSNSNPQYNQAWFRGGNTPYGIGGNNNIFGTNWNSPIYTVTNGTVRTRLNGTLTSNIKGVNQNVTGYFGIGFNPKSSIPSLKRLNPTKSSSSIFQNLLLIILGLILFNSIFFIHLPKPYCLPYCKSYEYYTDMDLYLHTLKNKEAMMRTIQYNTIQYNTIQYNTIQYPTAMSLRPKTKIQSTSTR